MTRRLLTAAIGALLLLAGCSPAGDAAAPKTDAAASAVGGPFQLTDANGRPVSDKTLLGKPTALFFGFTYCPEVCPTTLAELTAAMNLLGPQANQLNVVFVSVDPERDTPEQLKLYLSNFDPRIQGFTGTPAQIEAMAKAYRAYYQRVDLEGGGYTMDHASTVYLFDRKGRFVELVTYQTPPAKVAERLRALAALS